MDLELVPQGTSPSIFYATYRRPMFSMRHYYRDEGLRFHVDVIPSQSQMLLNRQDKIQLCGHVGYAVCA